MTPTRLIDNLYPAGSRRRDIYLAHCSAVAALALKANKALPCPLDESLVRDAALLHDIGITFTDAPSIDCHGDLPYILHGVAGADIIRRHGLDERFARVAERHTGSGITAAEIVRQGLPLPPCRCYMPKSLLEILIAWADKFYSKSGDMKQKPLQRVRAEMLRHGPDALSRFDRMHRILMQ